VTNRVRHCTKWVCSRNTDLPPLEERSIECNNLYLVENKIDDELGNCVRNFSVSVGNSIRATGWSVRELGFDSRYGAEVALFSTTSRPI